MALIHRINELTHQILPIQQMFISYQKLANGNFRFSGATFKKCAMKCQELIEIAREISEEINNNGEVKNG
jgi:hypothetical protein